MGDWDCDGVDSVGIYLRGFADVSNSNGPGAAITRVFYGQAGDIPLVGDWNGDGCDTLGLYRGGEVLIRNSLTTGPADKRFYFGQAGDVPFAGDFDGDGLVTVGMYRPENGMVYLSNSLRTGVAESEFFFGEPGDRFVAGDWDGDGVDTVGIYRPASGSLFLKNENSSGPPDIAIELGDAGRTTLLPVSGLFYPTIPVPQPSPEPTSEGPVLYRVNVGGPPTAAVDDGPDWTQDTQDAPSVFTNSVASRIGPSNVTSTDTLVDDDIPAEIFATERWDPPAGEPMEWAFPIEGGGLLQINLYFALPTAAVGDQHFRILGDDGVIVHSFDSVQGSGQGVGTRRTYFTNIADDELNVWFEQITTNPHLSGIEVLRPTDSVIDFTTQGADPAVSGDLLRYSLASAGAELEAVILGPGVFGSAPESSSFEVPDGVRLTGSGHEATLLTSDAEGPLMSVTGDVKIEHLGLLMNTDAGGIGILATGATGSFEDISISSESFSTGTAIVAIDSDLLISESKISLGTADADGIQAEDSQVTISDSSIIGSGSGASVRAESSSLVLKNAEIRSGSETADTATGLSLSASSLDVVAGTIAVEARQSAIALVLDNSVLTMTAGTLQADSSTNATTLSMIAARAEISDSALLSSGLSPRGVLATTSELLLDRTSVTVEGAAGGTVVENLKSTIDILDSVLTVTTSAGKGVGIENLGGGFRGGLPGALGSVSVRSSTVEAAIHIALNLPGVPVTFADSNLFGGTIVDPKDQISCKNVTDASAVVYPDSCPDVTQEP